MDPHTQIPPPNIGTQNENMGFTEYMSQIPANASMRDRLMFNLNDNPEYRFIVHKLGDNWREEVGKWRFKSWIIYKGHSDEYLEFVNHDEKITRDYMRCKGKVDNGMGFYDRTPFTEQLDHTHTVYHGVTFSAVHPVEDRAFSLREYAHLMGMPHDWEYFGNTNSFGSVIGQNVPRLTFSFWLSEIRRVIEDWDNKRVEFPISDGRILNHPSNVFMHDNIDPRKSHYG